MVFKKYAILCFSYLFLFTCFNVRGQQESLPDIKVLLQNDTLYVQNKHVSFTYLWNKGNLILKQVKKKIGNQKLSFIDNQTPSFYLPKEDTIVSGTKIVISNKRTFSNEQFHKEVSIYFTLGNLEVNHVMKIYANANAISHTYFLKGTAKASEWMINRSEDRQMIEKSYQNGETNVERIASFPFTDEHWKTTIVSFKESTDHHDNLVFEKELLPYRKKENLQGNIFFAMNQQRDIGLFFVKEAPIDYSQQYYAGYDFQVDHKSITVHGVGISPQDLSEEWIQGYGYAIGLAKSNKKDVQKEIIQYQKQLRKYIPERDEMILANTWGDRSKDSRMNETFILKEIEQASKIGITHLQLDDGWQSGLSRNSVSKTGQKWNDWSKADWQPNPERFPNGFETIIATAKKKNVELCLWFNPSKTNSYQFWERDADILIDYYNRHNIKVFKIDGISLTNKQSEINLRKLFTKVMHATEGKVTFNMDVTAGNRVGYHYFNEFGNVFLENRYTDWGNYYPHRTLRNLWMLAGYVPAERLQIEFLNNARNPKKYPKDDILAPQKNPLTYTSAITLAAQPLAWMELSSLSKIDDLKDQLAKYKEVSTSLHSSIILPIAKEPSGFSWTGFVAYQLDKPKYLLIYREYTGDNTLELNINGLKPNQTFNRILGNTISIHRDQKKQNKIKIDTQKQFSYGLFSID
ncbi:alpha-galactosidase [Aquimarina gracilis]|uniref:Alpha-galactosidase n=1 Tax=Aquimarina gracilis TaxID=874422 RepID=A0ABU5ZNZ6_9FLAO|nr:alpha-galactosidase [Aquimarina gracilis]MEB3343872.1 alpha-galactosidase [Aquimarina gracilis]